MVKCYKTQITWLIKLEWRERLESGFGLKMVADLDTEQMIQQLLQWQPKNNTQLQCQTLGGWDRPHSLYKAFTVLWWQNQRKHSVVLFIELIWSSCCSRVFEKTVSSTTTLHLPQRGRATYNAHSETWFQWTCFTEERWTISCLQCLLMELKLILQLILV